MRLHFLAETLFQTRDCKNLFLLRREKEKENRRKPDITKTYFFYGERTRKRIDGSCYELLGGTFILKYTNTENWLSGQFHSWPITRLMIYGISSFHICISIAARLRPPKKSTSIPAFHILHVGNSIMRVTVIKIKLDP